MKKKKKKKIREKMSECTTKKAQSLKEDFGEHNAVIAKEG